MASKYWIFIFLIFLLLISWSLVTFWQRFVENLFFNTWGFDPNSTSSTFWAAIISTSIFLLIIWIIKVMGVIPNIDMLIFDYQDTAVVGGALGSLQTQRLKPQRRATTIGGRISPRAALFV